MTSRSKQNVLFGVLGWVVPGIPGIAFGLAYGHGADDVVFRTVAVWYGVALVGCLVAGFSVGMLSGEASSMGAAFSSGLGGVALSWIGAIAASVAVDTWVWWLSIGGIAMLLPLPLLAGYAIAFAVGAVVRP